MEKLLEQTDNLIRVLIVDDEPSAREILREMLEADVSKGVVEIVGECASGKLAVELVKTEKPHLLFLDIQMPEIDGFEVLSALASDYLPLTVFVTAYDQYALRAFEVHALDYLLKPFDKARFNQVFEHAKRVIFREQTNILSEKVLLLLESHNRQLLKSTQMFVERLIIKTEGRVFFLHTEEIRWIKAEGNYASLNTAQKSYLLRESISLLEKKLNPQKFLRIHRSTIVNIDYVKELRPMFHGEYKVVLEDGTKLKLSRNYRDNLEMNLRGNL